MAQLGIVPIYRATDANGALLPNARLYTFNSGTLDAAATYTDEDLTTSNGAYVQANSSGLFPPFYLDPAVTYRIQLRISPYSSAVSGMDFDPVNSGDTSFSTITPEQFGAVGDYVTDDGPAFAAAIAYLKTTAYTEGSTSSSIGLMLGAKRYYLGTTTLDLTHAMLIEGHGSGQAGSGQTVLRWAANTTGIRLQRFNTSGADTVDGVTHTGSDGSVIRGLTLVGAYTNIASEGEYHAIHAKARLTVENCTIFNWQGDGVHIVATAGGGVVEGNANGFVLRKLRFGGCRDNVVIGGADANAGLIEMIDSGSARRWGISDETFLGNTYVACHTAENGVGASITPTVVSHGGKRYYIVAGQAVGASTNAPTGTYLDNTWWGWYEDGGVDAGRSVPAWTNGITIREGGPYRSTNVNAHNVFVGCYSESGQAPSKFVYPTLIIGGLHAAGMKGTGAWLENLQGVLGSRHSIGSIDAAGTSGTVIGHSGTHMSLFDPTDAPLNYTLKFDTGNLVWTYGNSGLSTQWAFAITGAATTNPMGAKRMFFPNGFGMGSGATTMRWEFGTAAPASGTWTRGSLVWNSEPSAAGVPGWVCTAGGTPGTWKAMAALAA